MKRILCAILAFGLFCSSVSFNAYAEDDYPDIGSAESTYRTLTGKNDINSRDEIKQYVQNADLSLSDGIANYTPQNEDNRLYFYLTPIVDAAQTEQIEIKAKIPVKISEMVLYFSHDGADWSEEYTFHITDIQPSDEFQTISINTSSNSAWSGNIKEYGITLKGAGGKSFDFDYIYFYSGYKPAYTENEKSRIYGFDSPDYGFIGNEYVSDDVSYNSELWARIAGSDAYFTTNTDFEMDADIVPQIKILYNNQTSGTNSRLYFTTDTEPNYNDKCSFNFESVSGAKEYVIDTADNTFWKGKITGLRFSPSDGEGIVRIDYIQLDKFPCTVSVREGVISGNGNLYNTAGRLSVEVYNTGTDTIDYKENLRTDLNGDFNFSFAITNEAADPIVYDLIFKSSVLAGTYKKRIIYVSETQVNKIFEEINNARINGDALRLKALIEENYAPLHLKAELYEELMAEGQHIEEIYTALLGKTSVNQDELEEHMNEAAVKVRVKYMSAEEWLKAIDDYDTYLKLKELPAYKTYESVSVSVREKIMSKMSAEHCSDFSAARDAFQKNTVLTALSRAVAWGDVKSILQTNAELLNIDFKEVNRLKSPSEAYRQLTEKTFTTFSEVKSAFDKAVEQQEKKEASQSSSTGGSGSGGGSKGGGSGIYSPIINIKDNRQPAAIPTPMPTVTPIPEIDVFNDLSGFEWAEQDILELYDNGIVSGTGNGCFEPSREVKREEFIKMLVSAFDLPLSTDVNFADVSENAWYAEYIGGAVKAGVAYGQGDIFGVGQIQSRQDVAVMAARALNIENETAKSSFIDFEEIADYAKAAVGALADENILAGYDDGTFRPLKALTRAEAAVIINRVRGRSAK